MSHPGKILKAARAALDLSREDVAKATGYEIRTVTRIETEHPLVSLAALEAVIAHYESKGVVFQPETSRSGPGLFLPKTERVAVAPKKKRVRKYRKKPDESASESDGEQKPD